MAIPELHCTDEAATDLLFDLQPSTTQLIDMLWSYHWLSPRGDNLLSFCRQDSDYWLQFPDLANFRISAGGKEVLCFPLQRTTQETVRHLLVDQVLPRCLAHQGRVMVHASAVKIDAGVLLFLGDSGAGKSTLAGNFHQAGSPVLSDDCVWIRDEGDPIQAVPSYGGLRLWDDSLEALFGSESNRSSMAQYSAKKRVKLGEDESIESGTGYPVRAAVVLSPPTPSAQAEVLLERLSPRETFIAILKQTFQLDLNDLERMSRHAQALGAVVPKIPAFRLSVPRDYAVLPLVRQRILEAVL